MDGERLFLGSQSLRSLELDSRRETGVITSNPEIIKQIATVYEADWLACNGPTPVVTDAAPNIEIAEEEIAAIIDAIPGADRSIGAYDRGSTGQAIDVL